MAAPARLIAGIVGLAFGAMAASAAPSPVNAQQPVNATKPKPSTPPAPAPAKPAAAKPGSTGSVNANNAPSGGAPKAVGELGSSKEPIAIDADRLDVFDKEGRAVFTGNVVAVQGETNMRCTLMNVLYESKKEKGEGAASSPTASLSNDSAIKKIECAGPVMIKTKTQTATGDRADFDRVANKFFITGNAALSDGPNVTRGERVAYDLNTGVANVEGGRVRALIVPGSQKEPDKPKETKPKPRQ